MNSARVPPAFTTLREAAVAPVAAVLIPSAPRTAEPGGHHRAGGEEPAAPNRATRGAHILDQPRPLPVTTGSGAHTLGEHVVFATLRESEHGAKAGADDRRHSCTVVETVGEETTGTAAKCAPGAMACCRRRHRRRWTSWACGNKLGSALKMMLLVTSRAALWQMLAVEASQMAVYKERTSGNCGDGGGGEWKITSIAACEAGAVAVGWYDTSARTGTLMAGCYDVLDINNQKYYGKRDLFFNPNNPIHRCNEDAKCLCTVSCVPGTYQDENGQSSCKTCASGTYSTFRASSCSYSATTCPVGTYASGTASCFSCGLGKYNDQTGQTSKSVACKSCGAGKYQNEFGKASCNPCVTGTYSSVAASNCFGIYKSRTSGNCGDSGGGWDKITSAAACGAGAAALGWGDTTASTESSSNNPPGCYYRSGRLIFNTYNGDYACNNNEKCLCALVCPPGTYQDQTGQSTCKSCPSDTYSIAGASSCPLDATSCPTGTYASGTATVCDSCGAGQYNDQTSQMSESVACKTCDAGKYQNEVGKASCNNDCVSPLVLTLDARCIDIIMYKERTSGNCGDSGGGWDKITSAAACGAGAAALGWGDTTASTESSSNNPPGCYYRSGRLIFNTYNGDYACNNNEKCLCALVCPPGTYQDQTGQSTCKSCPSDTYSIAGASSCPLDATSCPTGTYASGTATVCDSCGAGQYNDQTSQMSESVACKTCDAGKYQNEVGKASCTDCVSPMVVVVVLDASRCIDICLNTQGTAPNFSPKSSEMCSCGTTTCTESTGSYCNEKSNLCTKGPSSECGSSIIDIFDPGKCQVVTDRCECSQCISGYHTAKCIPCKWL